MAMSKHTENLITGRERLYYSEAIAIIFVLKETHTCISLQPEKEGWNRT